MKTTVAQLARDVGVKSQKIWYLINNGFLPAPAMRLANESFTTVLFIRKCWVS